MYLGLGIVFGLIVLFLLAARWFEKHHIVTTTLILEQLEKEVKILNRNKDFQMSGHIKAEIAAGHLKIKYKLTGFGPPVVETVMITSSDAVGACGIITTDNEILNFCLPGQKLVTSRGSEDLKLYQADALKIMGKIRSIVGPP